MARYNRLSVDGKRDFTAWRKSKAYAWPPTTSAEVMAMVAEMVRIEQAATREHDTYDGAGAADTRTAPSGDGHPTTGTRRRRNTDKPDAGVVRGTENSPDTPAPVPTTTRETPNETPAADTSVGRDHGRDHDSRRRPHVGRVSPCARCNVRSVAPFSHWNCN